MPAKFKGKCYSKVKSAFYKRLPNSSMKYHPNMQISRAPCWSCRQCRCSFLQHCLPQHCPDKLLQRNRNVWSCKAQEKEGENKRRHHPFVPIGHLHMLKSGYCCYWIDHQLRLLIIVLIIKSPFTNCDFSVKLNWKDLLAREEKFKDDLGDSNHWQWRLSFGCWCFLTCLLC